MELTSLINLVDDGWLLFATSLVFFMQAGFFILEVGLTRAKNGANVAAKNLADAAIAVTLFWLFGFALMHGKTSGGLGFFGATDFSPDLSTGAQIITPSGVSLQLATVFIYQAMFCANAVKILSGATAERLRFESYLLIIAVVSGFIYPLAGHWVWSGIYSGELTGWLGSRGFVDFAGATVVHSVGGWTALAALLVIGARIGRFAKDGTPQNIPRVSIPLATLGCFLLWFGWFGFNGGSTLLTNQRASAVIANTFLAGIAGMVTIIPIQIILNNGTVKVDMLINGALAGLVAITASAHAVSSQSAFIIGLVSTLIMLMLDWLLLRLRIDDAIGAVPVHLGGGLWGTLAVALFGDSVRLGTGLNWSDQISIQLTGMGITAIWAFFAPLMIFSAFNIFYPLRVTPEEEETGLTRSEQGEDPDFTEFPGLQELLGAYPVVQINNE